MKLIAMGLLAAGIVSGVVVFGMAQPNPRPDGPSRESGEARGARGERGPRDPASEQGNREQGEPGNREFGRREFHVLPPEAKDNLKLSEDQLKQIVELDKDVQAKLAKILTPAQLERWNQPLPPPPREAGPREAGPREAGPRDQQGPPPLRGERREEAGPPPRGEDGPPPARRGRDESGPRDRGPADRGPADRGSADRGSADRGPADRGPADRGPADRGPADRREPPSEGDRPAPRGEKRPEPRGISTSADANPQPPLPPPPHGPEEIDRALDELKLDGATRDKAHELIKAHHEKVRKFMDEQRAELVKQMKQLVGEAQAAEFEKSLPLPPPPPPER